MGTHYILCVHGIGAHSDNWVEDQDDGGQSFKELFFELVEKYPNVKNELDGKVKLVPIHYNDYFERIIDHWQTHLDTLLSFQGSGELMLSSQGYVKEIAEKAKQAEDAQEFWRTHIMDLVLFAGLGSIKEPVLLYVAKQILERCREAGPYDKFSIIGHSMGSSVVEKALKKLYNEDINNDTLKGDLKFRSICLIANCAYTLSRDHGSFYLSDFKPSGANDGMCERMFNVNHRWDPVGQFKPFDPDSEMDWLHPEDTWRYTDIQLKRLSSSNVHSINHYFRDPSLHIPYLRMLCDTDQPQGAPLVSKISAEEELQAQTAFLAKTPLGTYKSAYADLKALDAKNVQSFKEFHQRLQAMLALKDSFQAGMEDML